MDWKELFAHCWNSSLEYNLRVNDYIIHPDKLDTPERVAYYDRSAAGTIQRMEEYIEALRGYRQALAARYAALASMPYGYRLDLIRRRGWSNKRVTYTVSLVREYQDGHEEAEESTTYSGAQRREAFKAFEALKQSRPGIACNVDIEKRSWER
ncbi:MAG: hypothetical protein MRZ73_10980 [Pseudoflavonifractor capillosus]|uniref:hypothetical protein n=1 Tax=Pseudoflavonifractor capillosus TaxID=106588 RepID=UPI0023F98F04|nr:hypothetical protein [Pseudoflavonifractor capillosus]MCI5929040.1 hypothetical protein [Pseudoflavonifractor capillosus]MDY4662522.1 hypothetical protein [Pseudoflavonifractor capillosus]